MLVWEVRARSSVVQKIAMLEGWSDKAFAPLWRWSVLAKGHDNSVQLNWKQENISVWNGLTQLDQWANGKKPICEFSIQDASCCSVKNWFCFSSTSASQCRMMYLHTLYSFLCMPKCIGEDLDTSTEPSSIVCSMQMCDVHDTFFLILIPRSLTAAAANTSVNRNCEIRRDCCTRLCPNAFCKWLPVKLLKSNKYLHSCSGCRVNSKVTNFMHDVIYHKRIKLAYWSSAAVIYI